MLSRFFGERIGGVRFFDELTRLKQDPLVNYRRARTAVTPAWRSASRASTAPRPAGVATLQQIQRDLYETLRRVRPKVYRELSPRWQGQTLGQPAHPGCACRGGRSRASPGALLFGSVHFVLLYLLSGGVDLAATAMAMTLHDSARLSIERKVASRPPPPPPPPPTPAR